MNRTLLLAFLASLFCVFSCTEVSPEITIPQDTYSIDADGGELSLQMSSNVSLALRPSVDWIKIIAVSDGSCLVRVSANPDYNSRTGSVVFTHAESSLSKEIHILQGEQIGLVTKSNNYDLDYTGQTFSLPVSSNAELSVAVSADWIHPAKTKGLEEHTLSFQIDENLGKESRTAEILLSAGNKTQRVSVVQKATKSVPDTWEEIRESEKMASEVAQSVQTILASHSEDTPATTLAAEIEKLPQVISSSADQEGENIRLMKRDSTFTTVVLHPEKYGIDPTKLKASQKNSAVRHPSHVSRRISSSEAKKKVLLLAPFSSSYKVGKEEEGGRTVNHQWLEEEFGKVGVKLYYYPDGEADLSRFRADTLAKYDAVLIRTHGGCWEYKKYSDLPFTICTTGQDIETNPESFDPKLFSTLETQIMAGGSIPRYVITEAWLRATCGDSRFNSTIIYNGSCKSHISNDFASFFDEKGASGYYGFNEEINPTVATEVLYSICRSLWRGMTVIKTFNYTYQDPDLYTSSLKSLVEKYKKRFSWNINFLKTDYSLVDPTPFDLNHTFQGENVLLTWNVNPTKGNYKYTVVLDGWREYDAGTELSYTVPASGKYEHEWYVRADLYIGNEKIDTYTSETDKYLVTDTPFFTVTTGTPKDIFWGGATIPVSYDTNMDDHIFEGGVVYSYYYSEPEIGKSYCTRTGTNVNSNPFYVELKSLSSEVQYFARAYMITGESSQTPSENRVIRYGNVVSFETLPVEITPKESGLNFADAGRNPITSYGFGDVAIGSSATEVLLLQNLTHESITVHIKSVPEGFTADLQGDILYPGTSLPLVVAFNPTRLGNYSDKIVFDLGEYYYPIELPLYGTGVEPPDNTVAVTGVSLDKTELTLTVEDQYTLHATVHPSDATNKNVSWKSLEPSVAKVENGVVTALSPGSARILVTTEDGGYTATCIVTVRAINGGHEGTGGDEWNL